MVDLDTVLAVESGPDTAPWLGRTGRDWHLEALADNDIEHLRYLDSQGRTIGFAVITGLSRPGPLELRRLVVAAGERGRGHSRTLLALLIERVG